MDHDAFTRQRKVVTCMSARFDGVVDARLGINRNDDDAGPTDFRKGSCCFEGNGRRHAGGNIELPRWLEPAERILGESDQLEFGPKAHWIPSGVIDTSRSTAVRQSKGVPHLVDDQAPIDGRKRRDKRHRNNASDASSLDYYRSLVGATIELAVEDEVDCIEVRTGHGRPDDRNGVLDHPCEHHVVARTDHVFIAPAWQRDPVRDAAPLERHCAKARALEIGVHAGEVRRCEQGLVETVILWRLTRRVAESAEDGQKGPSAAYSEDVVGFRRGNRSRTRVRGCNSDFQQLLGSPTSLCRYSNALSGKSPEWPLLDRARIDLELDSGIVN